MLKKLVNDIKKGLYNAVNELGYVDESVIKIPEDIILDSTKDKEHGDYATNTAMRLAKVAKKKPLDIASEIVSKFDASAYHISKVEIAGPGFINFFVNKDSIAKMKKGVMIINTGRGPLINSEALVEGLKSGQVGAAGLDVYEEEHDYFYQDRSDHIITDDNLSRLMSLNNVLITSHQAFFTKEAMDNIVHTTLQNVTDFFEGKELVNEVKPQ